MDEFEIRPPEQLPAEPAGLRPRQVFSRTLWAYFVIFGAANGAILLLTLLERQYVPALLESDWGLLLTSLLPTYLVGLPLGWLILRRLPAEKPAAHALSATQLFVLLAMSFSIMYVGNLLGVGLNMGLSPADGGGLDNPVSELLEGMSLPASIVCVAILAPVMEELIFRKLLCDRLRAYGEGPAILVSGLVFGLFHANLYQFFYAFGVGSLFAYIYLRTGRVRYTMLLHAGINFLGGVLPTMLLRFVDLDALEGLQSGDMQQILAHVQGHTGELLALGAFLLAMFALFILGLVFLIDRRKKAFLLPGTRELPKTGRGGVIFGNPGMIFYLLLTGGATAFATLAL